MDNLNLDEEKRMKLQNFKSIMADVLEPRHDDRFLLRWLRARDFDLQKAEKMLREDFRWRKKMRSDNIHEEFIVPKETLALIPSAFLGFSKMGHLVRLFNAGHMDAKGLVRALSPLDVTKLTILYCESDAKTLQENNEKTGNDVETYIYIVDYSKLRLNRWCDSTVIKYAVYIASYYQDHYPETMHCVFAVNVPRFVGYIFTNILKPFLAESVIQKIKLYRVGDDSYKDELFSIVPREIVPAYLGGDRYEPEGDPMCHGLLPWVDRVPTSMYIKQQLTLDIEDPGVKQKIVQERSSFDVQREVDVPGSILSWEFQTKDRNIKFGLFFSRKTPADLSGKRIEDDAEQEVLLPLESTESHILVEKGEYQCEKRGIYTLHFDNTYSWLRSKQLFYKVELRNPDSNEE